ncbi:MAG: RNA 2',3'-cyclic phosphodiesterase [Deltaproteobacteria bacterium]|nr:RNA 2',3'-cyclic phosphodiesterase [Deltaproteobacteria bacterium]
MPAARAPPPVTGRAREGLKEEEAYRAFVAIEIPDDLRQRCAALIDRLREHAPGVGWVRPRNLHLTLKFLGTTRPSQAERLSESLAHKAAKLSPFAVSLEGLGAFPSPRRPRVLWVGIGEGREALSNLAGKVDGAAGKAGFSRETRAFSPHLTLGRVKMVRVGSVDWPGLIARLDPGPLGRFTADALTLFRSELGPGGAVHTPLRRVPLGRRRNSDLPPGADETS